MDRVLERARKGSLNSPMEQYVESDKGEAS
jgi:hypothetical protein